MTDDSRKRMTHGNPRFFDLNKALESIAAKLAQYHQDEVRKLTSNTVPDEVRDIRKMQGVASEATRRPPHDLAGREMELKKILLWAKGRHEDIYNIAADALKIADPASPGGTASP